jgi:hypothetical protein
LVPDQISVPLPPEIGPGRYELVVGLYNPLTGERLTVPGRADNTVLLTELRLK